MKEKVNLVLLSLKFYTKDNKKFYKKEPLKHKDEYHFSQTFLSAYYLYFCVSLPYCRIESNSPCVQTQQDEFNLAVGENEDFYL